MNAKQALRRVGAPDEHAAGQRAWTVVRSAYQAREPVVAPPSRRRYALALALALAVAALGFSPAGATVGHFITRALGIQHAASALSSLPTSGKLLVSGPDGTWSVAADGSIRRLGPWTDVSWSPHGRYVAVASPDRLTAIDPHGVVQWTVARVGVDDPRWFSPSGYRVAYLAAGQLRVLAGDGTGDHLLASAVASVAPAWRPGRPFQLAYVTAHGTVLVRDADTGQTIWSRPARGATRLQWSADGRYLLAASASQARILNAQGGLITRVAAPAGSSLLDASLSPRASLLAIVLGGPSAQVVLVNFSGARPTERRVLVDPGLQQAVWSPDGRWLLITWPAADEWVFVRVIGPTRIAAVSHIAQQFSGRARGGGFPQLDGWCCSAK